jgi:hypothetical protein
MQRRYVTVDVFTDRPFGGNPLAAERLHHPVHRRVLPVLYLHPMLGPASLIRPVTTFRYQVL